MRFVLFSFVISVSVLIYFTCEVNSAADKVDTNSDAVGLRDKTTQRLRATANVIFKDRDKISNKAQRKCQEFITSACNGTLRSNLRKTKTKTRSHVLQKRARVVVGGRDSLPKEYPHMVLIGFGDYSEVQWKCGGSIISETYILSAGHCTSSSGSPARWARLGELDLNSDDDDANPKDFPIIEIITHPEYKFTSVYNDIALFKLNVSIRFSSYIRPICLNSRQDLNFSKVTATGWGSTGYGETGSPKLQSVDIYIQDDQKCKNTYPASTRLENGFNTSTMICAGYLAGGKDTCQGDSGGPLHVEMEGGCSKINSQIGITSYGEGCGFVDTPAIYTKISFYIPWIENIVWK